MWWIKIWKEYLKSEDSQTHTRLPSPGLQCQKINSHNFWLQKADGIDSVEENCWSPKQFLLKNAHKDSPTQTHYL